MTCWEHLAVAIVVVLAFESQRRCPERPWHDYHVDGGFWRLYRDGTARFFYETITFTGVIEA